MGTEVSFDSSEQSRLSILPCRHRRWPAPVLPALSLLEPQASLIAGLMRFSIGAIQLTICLIKGTGQKNSSLRHPDIQIVEYPTTLMVFDRSTAA